jgi:chromosome segregation ATPase
MDSDIEKVFSDYCQRIQEQDIRKIQFQAKFDVSKSKEADLNSEIASVENQNNELLIAKVKLVEEISKLSEISAELDKGIEDDKTQIISLELALSGMEHKLVAAEKECKTVEEEANKIIDAGESSLHKLRVLRFKYGDAGLIRLPDYYLDC